MSTVQEDICFVLHSLVTKVEGGLYGLNDDIDVKAFFEDLDEGLVGFADDEGGLLDLFEPGER